MTRIIERVYAARVWCAEDVLECAAVAGVPMSEREAGKTIQALEEDILQATHNAGREVILQHLLLQHLLKRRESRK